MLALTFYELEKGLSALIFYGNAKDLLFPTPVKPVHSMRPPPTVAWFSLSRGA